jgi:copper oxidase (laccase) domain-containing protein
MADALGPFRAAIRDLNRRLEAAEARIAELTETNNDLVACIDLHQSEITMVKETLWPKSHTMDPQALADAVYTATKDDPVQDFAKSSSDGVDFFRRYSRQVKDLD